MAGDAPCPATSPPWCCAPVPWEQMSIGSDEEKQHRNTDVVLTCESASELRERLKESGSNGNSEKSIRGCPHISPGEIELKRVK